MQIVCVNCGCRDGGACRCLVSRRGYYPFGFGGCREAGAAGGGDSIRVDLQEGDVRTPKKFSYVLPFAYSPTNFTGTVDGMSSRVSIVQIEGTDLDVMKWVSEVAGTARVLKDSTDEGEVVWKAKRGVWKVTFEILDGATVKDVQTKLLDLRNATGNGLAIMLF